MTYEYAGRAGGGGIGTYVRNAAAALAARGHAVEVFTVGEPGRGLDGDVTVHAVRDGGRAAFVEAVVDPFVRRHEAAPFDAVESAEYGAEGAGVAAALPGLPLVVKLHTPTFLVDEINRRFEPWTRRARFVAGALRRGRRPRPYWTYDPSSDPERALALRADEVTSPSRSLLEIARDRWGLDGARLAHVPNVFVPPAALSEVPAETRTRHVTFVGKLEVRKGVVALADAVPHVLSRVPDARFRLVGRSLPHPATGEPLDAWLRRRLGRHAAAVEVVEAVPYAEVPAVYAASDVCVVPSVWENFPNVCLEAMAAARGVVASAAGGMAEMVEDGATGRLVPPRDPRALADAVVGLLRDDAARARMGRAARAHVASAYAPAAVAPLMEASYRRAMSRP